MKGEHRASRPLEFPKRGLRLLNFRLREMTGSSMTVLLDAGRSCQFVSVLAPIWQLALYASQKSSDCFSECYQVFWGNNSIECEAHRAWSWAGICCTNAIYYTRVYIYIYIYTKRQGVLPKILVGWYILCFLMKQVFQESNKHKKERGEMRTTHVWYEERRRRPLQS